jgi:hypothetical protein
MRKFATVSFVLTVVAAISCAQDAPSIKWTKDFDAGMKEAKTSGKLAMIDFYAEW